MSHPELQTLKEGEELSDASLSTMTPEQVLLQVSIPTKIK